MKRSVFLASAIILFLSFYADLSSSITLYRTFVNGNNSENSQQEVYDLHIEYSRGIDSASVVSWSETGKADIKFNGKKVDIIFPDKVPSGSSVSVAAYTSSTSLEIESWYWTDQNHKIVVKHYKNVEIKDPNTGEVKKIDRSFPKSVYGPWERGDESPEEVKQISGEKKNPGLNPNNIYNKAHHWGGKDRIKNKVQLKLDISKLLKNKPADLNADDLEANIKAAVKQVTDCTGEGSMRKVPKAGEKDNPENDGPGKDPAIMTPGPSHSGVKGKKFRSVTEREAGALMNKYPKGLEIEVVGGKGFILFENNVFDITGGWGISGTSSSPNTLGLGPSKAGKGKDKDKTVSGEVKMNDKVKWHLAKDTDKDTYITNKDGDIVPDDAYDFYSVFKHELMHVLCFNHSGDILNFNNFVADQPVGFLPGMPALPGDVRYPSNCWIGDEDSVSDKRIIFFSSQIEGGFGGWDIYQACFHGDSYSIINLGPTINTSFNEICPNISSDGSELLFSSDRPGGLGGYDLYSSELDYNSYEWMLPENVGNELNSIYNEINPYLSANMMNIFYTSDRIDGFGKYDIWLSELIPGHGFSPPWNLGSNINTSFDELSPALSPTGNLLVFSSDRDGGFGAYDLWYSQSRSAFSKPLPFPMPVNSPFNENDASFSLDFRNLYFSSDRITGNDNFYKLQTIYLFEDGFPKQTEFYGDYLKLTAENNRGSQILNIKNKTYSEIYGFIAIFTGITEPEKPLKDIEPYHIPNFIKMKWKKLNSYTDSSSQFKLLTEDAGNPGEYILPENNFIGKLIFNNPRHFSGDYGLVLSALNSDTAQILKGYCHEIRNTYEIFPEIDGKNAFIKACFNGYNGSRNDFKGIWIIPDNINLKINTIYSDKKFQFDKDNSYISFNEKILPGEEFSFTFVINDLELVNLNPVKIYSIADTVSENLNIINNTEDIDFRILPNPAENSIKLVYHTEKPGNLELKCFDLNGKLIFINYYNINDSYGQKDINISDLPAGTYFFELKINNFRKTKLIIK